MTLLDPALQAHITEADLQLDLGWVEKITVLDAIDTTPVEAALSNPGWRLLHVGTGKGGQTTLSLLADEGVL